MCNDVSHAPEVWQAGMLGVYQQGSFSVGDEAPVLHSPSSKVRDAYQIQFWQRVWDPKQGLKSWQHLHSDVKGSFQIPSPAPATYSTFKNTALMQESTNLAVPATYSILKTQPQSVAQQHEALMHGKTNLASAT